MKTGTTDFNRFWIACVAGLAVAGGFLGATALAQTPVAHWTFDDGINNYDLTTATDIQNGNNGVWQQPEGAGLSYAAGVIGGAARLGGGGDQYFEVPSIPQIDGIVALPEFPGLPELGVGATWMGWIKIDADAPTGNLYKGILVSRSVTDLTINGTESGQNWGLAWQRSNAPQGSHLDTRVSGQAVDSPDESLAHDTWYHVAVVWGNTDSEGVDWMTNPGQVAYINGVPVGSSERPVWELVSSGSWLIGEDSCCGGREFPGLLDDLAVFNSALSDAQILAKYNAGLNGIDASGNNTGTLLPGDVDGLNGVTIDDFNIILNNLGKEVTARNLGDLNGNRQVELDDYQEWLENVPASVAATASIPEPTGLVLLGLALLGGGLLSRHLGFCAGANVAMLLMISVTSLHAQDLALVVERATGDLSFTGASETVVDLAGYQIGSQRQTLVPANYNGLRDTEADWVEAGIPSSSSQAELNSNGDPTAATSINDAVALGLGAGAYNPTQALLDTGFGVDVEENDLSLTYYDTVLDVTRTGVIEFVGEKIYNNIGITVDLADGTAIIENESPFNQVITGYLIESTTEDLTLNTDLGTFTGLRGHAAGSAFEAPAALDGENLGELDPTGAGIALNAGGTTDSSYALGTIGGTLDGLTVSFLLAGSGQASMTGFVKYLEGPTLPGDYNGNGQVEQGDLDLVLLNWGNDVPPDPDGWVNDLPTPDNIDQDDLDRVLLNWGSTGAAAAGVAVPEPASLLMTLLGCFAAAAIARKGNCG